MNSLGNRMKDNYESVSNIKLIRRMPVIIRLDGRCFHSLTKKWHCKKPFDPELMETMIFTTRYLMENIQGCYFAYTQSDEISLLLIDYTSINSEAWFNNELNKIVSVSSSMCTAGFNHRYINNDGSYVTFDSRAFNIPREEVANYFLWRAKDWKRNSLQMYARSFFSHKELHNKNSDDIHEMLHNIKKNWTTDLNDQEKNGTFFFTTFTKENGNIISNGIHRLYSVLPDYSSMSEIIDPIINIDKK